MVSLSEFATRKQTEVRKWCRDVGISVNDKGSLSTDYYDMHFVAKMNLGVPVAELRQWVKDCRAWVNLNEIHLDRSDMLCKEDVDAYLEYLTGEADEVREQAEATDLANEIQQATGLDMVTVTVKKPSPMQMVREQERAGTIHVTKMALSQAENLVECLDADARTAEMQSQEAYNLAAYAAERISELSNEFHMMYCTGCGSHENRTGQ